MIYHAETNSLFVGTPAHKQTTKQTNKPKSRRRKISLNGLLNEPNKTHQASRIPSDVFKSLPLARTHGRAVGRRRRKGCE